MRKVRSQGLAVIGLAIALLAAVAVGACGDDDGGGDASASGDTLIEGNKARDDIRIEYISHGVASDPFFSILKNGLDQAEQDFGVDVEYRATEVFDPVDQARLIEQAVATEPDGIVASVPDPDALVGPLKGATDAGIPVVLFNIGYQEEDEIGAIGYVGEDHFLAAKTGGEALKDAGATKALCVNHSVGVVALDIRCDGFAEGLGGEVKVLAVNGEDPTATQNRIEAALQDESIDGVFTLGPPGAEPALDAIEASGRAGEVQLGTFDLTPRVLEAVRDGEMAFAIDQQQYLQSYMAIQILTSYIQFGLAPTSDVNTGGRLITEDNAADAIALSEAGVR